MTSDQHHRELRVLRGPQAGSRLALSAGEYLLGSSDECTIILSGPRMQPQHVLLQMGDETIQLVAQDGTACDTAGAEIEEEREIELGEPFELGGIWIAIDEPDAPWPDEEDISALGATPPAEPQPEQDEKETTPDAPSEPGEGAAAPSPDAGADTSAEANANTGMRAAKRLALPLAVTAIAAAAMVFTLRFALADTSTDVAQNTTIAPIAEPAPAPASAPAPTPPDVLQRLDPAGKLQATQTDTGTWKVSGYVATAQQRNTIVAALSELVPPPETAIHADDEMLTAAAEVLAARPYGTAAKLRIESAETGRLKLEGAVRDPSLLDAAALALIKGVPGAHAVESGVLLPEELLARLKGRLGEAALQDRLNVVAEAAEVLLSGHLNESEVARWEQVRTAFRRDYADALVLKTAFTRPVAKLPFEVKTIVGGPAPYIVTSTGEHVARGGRIAGLTLSSVGDTQVVFDGNQRLMLAR